MAYFTTKKGYLFLCSGIPPEEKRKLQGFLLGLKFPWQKNCHFTKTFYPSPPNGGGGFSCIGDLRDCDWARMASEAVQLRTAGCNSPFLYVVFPVNARSHAFYIECE